MKKQKFALAIIVTVLAVLVIGLYKPLLKDVIPISRTYFQSYVSFKASAEYCLYPEELPLSAHDIEYYVYEGFLADKSAYHVVYSSEDYEYMKKIHMEKYSPTFGSLGYLYDGQMKLQLELGQVEQNKVEFLSKVLPKEDFDKFYFLAYVFYESDEEYYYSGVLCNDETCEVVEFTCRLCNSL